MRTEILRWLEHDRIKMVSARKISRCEIHLPILLGWCILCTQTGDAEAWEGQLWKFLRTYVKLNFGVTVVCIGDAAPMSVHDNSSNQRLHNTLTHLAWQQILLLDRVAPLASCPYIMMWRWIPGFGEYAISNFSQSLPEWTSYLLWK